MAETGLGVTPLGRQVIYLREVVACRTLTRAQRSGGLLAVFAFWLGITTALGADRSDLTKSPQSNTLPEEFGADRAQRIRALHNPCLGGRVVTCYTPGYRARAISLQQFLTGELSFVRQRLGVPVTLVLAVLDERQWPLAEQQLPYAMPSVHGDPPIALVAANWAAARDFYPKVEEAGNPVLLREIAVHGLTWDQANAQVGDLLTHISASDARTSSGCSMSFKRGISWIVSNVL
jgi:hypothetical protein